MLSKLYVSLIYKLVLTRKTGLKVWLKLGFKLNHLSRNRAQNLVKDNFCCSSSARQVPGGTLAIVLDIATTLFINAAKSHQLGLRMASSW